MYRSMMCFCCHSPVEWSVVLRRWPGVSVNIRANLPEGFLDRNRSAVKAVCPTRHPDCFVCLPCWNPPHTGRAPKCQHCAGCASHVRMAWGCPAPCYCEMLTPWHIRDPPTGYLFHPCIARAVAHRLTAERLSRREHERLAEVQRLEAELWWCQRELETQEYEKIRPQMEEIEACHALRRRVTRAVKSGDREALRSLHEECKRLTSSPG